MLGLSVFTHLHKMLNSITQQYIILTAVFYTNKSLIHPLASFRSKYYYFCHILCSDMQRNILFSVITIHVGAWKAIWRPLSIENDLDSCAYFPSKCNTIASKNLLSYIQECTKLLWILQRTSLTFCTLHVYEQ